MDQAWRSAGLQEIFNELEQIVAGFPAPVRTGRAVVEALRSRVFRKIPNLKPGSSVMELDLGQELRYGNTRSRHVVDPLPHRLRWREHQLQDRADRVLDMQDRATLIGGDCRHLFQVAACLGRSDQHRKPETPHIDAMFLVILPAPLLARAFAEREKTHGLLRRGYATLFGGSTFTKDRDRRGPKDLDRCRPCEVKDRDQLPHAPVPGRRRVFRCLAGKDRGK